MAKKNEIAKVESASIQPLENIENLIHVIRGKQVMLDRDLARLYGVETGRLNEQVKRNIERFPEDFMFQLDKEEFENWKSQFVISNLDDSSKSQFATLDDEEKWKSQFAISNSIKMGARKLPYAFTESGIAMLSGVLRSPQAVSMKSVPVYRRYCLPHWCVPQRSRQEMVRLQQNEYMDY